MVVRGDEGRERGQTRDALKPTPGGAPVHESPRASLEREEAPEASGGTRHSHDSTSLGGREVGADCAAGLGPGSSAAMTPTGFDPMSIGERVALKRRSFSGARRLADHVPHVRQTYNW